MDPSHAAIGVAGDDGFQLPSPLRAGKHVEALEEGSLYQVAGQGGSFTAPKLWCEGAAHIGRCPYFEDLKAVQPSAMAIAAALPRLETPSLESTDETWCPTVFSEM